MAGRDFLRDAPADEVRQFQEAMRTPPADADLVMAQAEGRGHLLRGRVRAMDAEGLRALFDAAQAHLPWSRIRWLALSVPSSSIEERPAGFRLRLTDGSVVEADKLRWQGDELTGERRFAAVRVEAAAVVGLDISSERYRYVSELEPAQVKLTPVFDVAWPPRMDRCVSGGPIALGGRVYERGIGMGTRTEMTYRLGGAYTHFCATIGVDDSAAERGRVVFVVLADGKEVFRSPLITGASEAMRVAVALNNAQTVTIISDFGSDVRAEGSFADWAEARLVRAGDTPEQP